LNSSNDDTNYFKIVKDLDSVRFSVRKGRPEAVGLLELKKVKVKCYGYAAECRS
jgi:hypothetical protein